MLAWINELTDLPDWQHKIFDPEFTFDWKSAKVMTGYDVVRSMADWVGHSFFPIIYLMVHSVWRKSSFIRVTLSVPHWFHCWTVELSNLMFVSILPQTWH